MRMSSVSSKGKSSAIVSSTIAAGTISQMARGCSSLFHKILQRGSLHLPFSLTSSSQLLSKVTCRRPRTCDHP